MPKLLSDRDFDRVARVVRRVEGMTDRLQPGSGGASLVPQPITITFVNESTEEVPAFGVMAVTGAGWSATAGPYITIEKPSDTVAKVYAVNGPVNVAKDAAGQCFLSGWCRVLYDTGTPAVGELWGPKADQWSATLSGVRPLLTILDSVDATNKYAIASLTSFGSLTPRILYDDVAPGDENKLAWPVASDMTADTAADKVTIQNTFPGHFRGYGDAHTDFDATTAAKVWTTIGTDGKEHIVCGKGLAKRCSAALTANAAPGATNVTVDTVVVLDGGQLPVANSTSATIANCVMPPEASALDNATCIIEWAETAGVWACSYLLVVRDHVVGAEADIPLGGRRERVGGTLGASGGLGHDRGSEPRHGGGRQGLNTIFPVAGLRLGDDISRGPEGLDIRRGHWFSLPARGRGVRPRK